MGGAASWVLGNLMPYIIKHDSQLGVIEVTYAGLITGADLQEATAKAIALQKQTGITNFLVDTDEGAMAVSLLDVYNVVATQYQEVDRRTRIATILPTSPSLQEAVHFYETIAYNRGWNVKVWADRRSAMDWLLGRADK